MTPPPGASLNPFKTALNKLVHKKKDLSSAATGATGATGLTSAATSGFFLRGHNKPHVQTKASALPGSIKQVNTGQLPPVWVTPAPAPPTRCVCLCAWKDCLLVRCWTVGDGWIDDGVLLTWG